MRSLYYHLYFLILLLDCVLAELDTTSVKVEQGLLSGTAIRSFKGYFVNAFLGVPYAEPPVKELRFKDPQPPQQWEGIRDATEMPEPCLQLSRDNDTVVGSEDCLYLNIYPPQKPSRRKVPVMVFIHGGFFVYGGARDYSPRHFMDNDVVLVVIQYRLGVFGFLSTEDDIMPGNIGLKDQLLALRWIKANIQRFNGDPDRITLFGENAGAASVHLHMMSPQSKNLFHRAIAQSGNALCPWARGEDHRKFAQKLGEEVSCSLEKGSQQYLKCLQSVDGQNIMDYHKKSQRHIGDPGSMTPRVDGDFLLDYPENILIQEKYNKNVTFMMGIRQDEGRIALAMKKIDLDNEDHLQKFLSKLPDFLHIPEEHSKFTNKMVKSYFGDGNLDTKEKIEILYQMAGDRFLNLPFAIAASEHARTSAKNFYTYALDYKITLTYEDDDGFVHHKQEPVHQDLWLLFNGGGAFPKQLVIGDDLFMKRIVFELWSSFARIGDPTSSKSSMFKWIPTTTDNFQQAKLSLKPSMTNITVSPKISLWMTLPFAKDSILEMSDDKDEL